MSTSVVSMEPGEEIYKAFKIVLLRRYNQIPVKEGMKIVGIVDSKSLVETYYEMIGVVKKNES